MDKDLLIKTVTPVVEGRGCFLVGVAVTPDNDVTVTIESAAGSVDMDDCVAVNDAVLAAFDRDEEDYSLTVTSAGLDQPFAVQRQFEKAVGSKVEVKVKDGRRLVCTLMAADESSIDVAYQVKEAVEGKKKKELVDKAETILKEKINSVKYYIEFK